MHDMLVKLYGLDTYLAASRSLPADIVIRKPIGPEKFRVAEWVKKKFYEAWASEFEMALANRPITCYIAVRNREPVGFACYDATVRGFFGPMGVDGSCRKKGIGSNLSLAVLADMRAAGYGYAIIGGVGPADFYRKIAGAVDIAGSDPGIWKTWIL
jgi:GNAT superfamily N-acetyltransferase